MAENDDNQREADGVSLIGYVWFSKSSVFEMT